MDDSSRRHTLELAGLLLLGAVLRLGLASGYGLGDDPGYLASYAQMARGPVFDPGAQYSNRFAIAVPVAVSLWATGFREVGFIGPVTLASLLNLLLVYLIARDEWGRASGRLALALFAVLPLEILCATLFAPDVILATYTFGAYWLLGRALAAPPRALRGRLFAVAAGLACTLGFLSKPWVVLAAPAFLWESRRHWRTHRVTLLVAALAVGVPVGSYLTWQAIVLGDPLHHIHVTQPVAVFAPYGWATFFEYPAMLLRPTEYGTWLAGLHPHLLIALALLFAARTRTLAKWLVYTLMLMTGISAMPAHAAAGHWETLVPRIFRYLTFITIPMCLALTAYLRAAAQRWPRATRGVIAVLLIGSVPASVRLTAPSRDAFGEMRRLDAFLGAYPDDVAYLQSDCAKRFGILTLGDRARERAVALRAETPEARATELAAIREGLVVTGGAGLPWYGCARCVVDLGALPVPAGWRLVATFADRPLTVYRREPLRVWRVRASEAEADRMVAEALDRSTARAAAVAALGQRGRAEVAVAMFERLVATARADETPVLLHELGRACLAAERPACGIQTLTAARDGAPSPAARRDATVDLIRAYTHPHVADYVTGRALAARLAQEFPETRDDGSIRWAISRVSEARDLYHQERLAAARRVLVAALADPSLPDDERDLGLYFRALVAFREREVADGVAARDAYRARRGADPQWVELLYREAEARRWGERAAAVALLEQVVRDGGQTAWPELARVLQHEIEHPKTAATDP